MSESKPIVSWLGGARLTTGDVRKVGAPKGRVLTNVSRGDVQDSATEKRPPMARSGYGKGETVR